MVRVIQSLIVAVQLMFSLAASAGMGPEQMQGMIDATIKKCLDTSSRDLRFKCDEEENFRDGFYAKLVADQSYYQTYGINSAEKVGVFYDGPDSHVGFRYSVEDGTAYLKLVGKWFPTYGGGQPYMISCAKVFVQGKSDTELFYQLSRGLVYASRTCY